MNMKIGAILSFLFPIALFGSVALGYSEEESSFSITDQRQADTIQVVDYASIGMTDKQQAQTFTSDQSED
ncbi:MAG: hypothetical protein K2X47_11500 [Bdellovibrionales bacterium]|nr:hypothetical protein [Bdellovibrionales bacterium]